MFPVLIIGVLLSGIRIYPQLKLIHYHCMYINLASIGSNFQLHRSVSSDNFFSLFKFLGPRTDPGPTSKHLTQPAIVRRLIILQVILMQVYSQHLWEMVWRTKRVEFCIQASYFMPSHLSAFAKTPSSQKPFFLWLSMNWMNKYDMLRFLWLFVFYPFTHHSQRLSAFDDPPTPFVSFCPHFTNPSLPHCLLTQLVNGPLWQCKVWKWQKGRFVKWVELAPLHSASLYGLKHG